MAGIGSHMQRSGRSGRVMSVAAPEEGRAASKADAAFEEFVRARSAHLLRLALLLTGWNGAVAEDLTQTALERAYGRRRTLFGTDRAAEPYVRRVLVNAAIDWRRGLRRRAELPLDRGARLAAPDLAAGIARRGLRGRAPAPGPPRQRAGLGLGDWGALAGPRRP